MLLQKTTLLLLVFFTVGAFTTHAQTVLPDTAYYPRHKWEIATDLLWLINKNTIPASNIFIRKHLQHQNKKFGAIRVRMGVSYDREDFALINTIGQVFPDYKRDYTLFSRLGYERQKPFGKFQLLYGADVQMQYVRNIDEKTDFIGTQPEAYPQTTLIRQNTLEPALFGFVGAKYFISSHFAVSSELTLGSTFKHYEYYLITYDNDKGYNTKEPWTFGYSHYRINSWKLNLQPLSVLNFSYLF